MVRADGRNVFWISLALVCIALGLPAGGHSSDTQGGGASGSFGNRADAYLSFSITGGSLKLRAGTPSTYEGTWGGGAVTLSGEMIVDRSGGGVSYVTMSASVNGRSWRWPPPGDDGRVSGRTVSKRYDLTYRPPAGFQGTISGSATLQVCGGVCGTYSVSFSMTVPKTGPPSTTPKPTGLPTVQAFAPSSKTPAGPLKMVSLGYSVKDPSGKATVHLAIYQGGTRVLSGSGTGAATGKRLATKVRLPGNLVGPLFFCVWAENAQGKRSAGNPRSSCAWIPFLLPKIKRVSNGCGGEGWEVFVAIENYFGNKHSYVDSNVNPNARSYTVDFVTACDLHDAGYAGVMVNDTINHGPPVDYRTWSRKQVDDKFRDDMFTLCDRQIPASATVARAKCKSKGGPLSIGALTLYSFVRTYGWHFFDADLTEAGVQKAGNYVVKPKGGARSNFP